MSTPKQVPKFAVGSTMELGDELNRVPWKVLGYEKRNGAYAVIFQQKGGRITTIATTVLEAMVRDQETKERSYGI